jgi:hypothetical protein
MKPLRIYYINNRKGGDSMGHDHDNNNHNRPIDFNTFELGDPIRVVVEGLQVMTQTGFFIAFQNNFLYWGAVIDGQARLVITPVNAIQSIVRI